MDFSASSLIAGIFFGIWGLAIFRIGKNDANPWQLGIGIVLMIFPYFISQPLIEWGVGLALMYGAYYVRRF